MFLAASTFPPLEASSAALPEIVFVYCRDLPYRAVPSLPCIAELHCGLGASLLQHLIHVYTPEGGLVLSTKTFELTTYGSSVFCSDLSFNCGPIILLTVKQ